MIFNWGCTSTLPSTDCENVFDTPISLPLNTENIFDILAYTLKIGIIYTFTLQVSKPNVPDG